MTFEVTYDGLFGSGTKTQVLDAEGIEQAKQTFLHVKSGVPESRIKEIREIVAAPPPTHHIVWTDKRTGDPLRARSDFIEKLPALLKNLLAIQTDFRRVDRKLDFAPRLCYFKTWS